MIDVHAPWIEGKIDQILPYFVSGHKNGDNNSIVDSLDPRTRIKEAFYSGFVPVLTQEYKVEKDSIGFHRTSSDVGLDNIIAGYTVDFYRTLRVCERAGVNPNTALRIAQLSHNHNPNVLIELSTDPRYKDLNPSVIERAALSYPKNPEAFLDGFRQKGLLEYLDFWTEFINHNMAASALRSGRLTAEEIFILRSCFEDGAGMPKKSLLEKLTIVVANLI